jgi:hypothetical protein
VGRRVEQGQAGVLQKQHAWRVIHTHLSTSKLRVAIQPPRPIWRSNCGGGERARLLGKATGADHCRRQSHTRQAGNPLARNKHIADQHIANQHSGKQLAGCARRRRAAHTHLSQGVHADPVSAEGVGPGVSQDEVGLRASESKSRRGGSIEPVRMKEAWREGRLGSADGGDGPHLPPGRVLELAALFPHFGTCLLATIAQSSLQRPTAPSLPPKPALNPDNASLSKLTHTAPPAFGWHPR